MFSNRRCEHIRASKELDDVIREIAKQRGFSKRQASDYVAFQIKKMMKNRKQEEKDFDFQFW